VLRKCANPVCCAQFRYLHQGKLFEIEAQYSESRQVDRQPEPGNSKAHIERWWLCDECAAHITLRFDRRQGLVMRHSVVGKDEVLTTTFAQSGGRTLLDVTRVLIWPLGLESKLRRNWVGSLRVEERDAA
jgi:hypothetical protein